jgi:hypothetical protein
MEKERFVKMLQDLQQLQMEATLKGVHSFIIRSYYDKADPELGDEPDEFSIGVTVFLRGDDTELDYYRAGFYESQEPAEWFRSFNNLKAFVSCL